MDCLIHVGLHKTATTSFQNFLFNETTFLTSFGIIYPVTILEKTSKQHSILPGYFFKDHPAIPKDPEKNIEDYIRSLRKEIYHSKMKLCVISSEVFTELNDVNYESTKIIIEYFKNIFDKITILISTRNPKERALSMYQHKMRRSSIVRSFRRELFESPQLYKNKIQGTNKSIEGWKKFNLKIIMVNISKESLPIRSLFEEVVKLTGQKNILLLKTFIKNNKDFFVKKNILMNKNHYEPVSYIFTSVVGLFLVNAENDLKEKICFSDVNLFLNNLDDKSKNILSTITNENLIKFLSLETKFRIKESNIIDVLIKADISFSASFILKKHINVYINNLICN